MADQYSDHLTEEEMKCAIKSGTLFRGKIYFTNDNLERAIVRVHLFEKEINIVYRENLNRALHGDIVCVEIFEENKWLEKKAETVLGQEEMIEIEDIKEMKEEEIEETMNQNLIEKIRLSPKLPVGRIRGILRRNRMMLCGTIFNPKDSSNCSVDPKLMKIQNFSIFIPIDPKFPTFLVRLYNPELYYNKRILVKFNEWGIRNPLPSAHFLKNIGELLDVIVENEVILLEHNVDSNPFPKRIIDSLPKLETLLNIPQEEIDKRLDIRKYIVVIINFE
jgi:exosome complex exonuclease DIS3/RRP44